MPLHDFPLPWRERGGVRGDDGFAGYAMVVLTCDMCGKVLLADEDVRYIARIEVFAAYDPMEITSADLAKDHEDEMRRLLEQTAGKDAEELEAEVYKQFRFDLCPACQRKYVKAPLSRTDREDDA